MTNIPIRARASQYYESAKHLGQRAKEKLDESSWWNVLKSYLYWPISAFTKGEEPEYYDEYDEDITSKFGRKAQEYKDYLFGPRTESWTGRTGKMRKAGKAGLFGLGFLTFAALMNFAILLFTVAIGLATLMFLFPKLKQKISRLWHRIRNRIPYFKRTLETIEEAEHLAARAVGQAQEQAAELAGRAKDFVGHQAQQAKEAVASMLPHSRDEGQTGAATRRVTVTEPVLPGQSREEARQTATNAAQSALQQPSVTEKLSGASTPTTELRARKAA